MAGIIGGLMGGNAIGKKIWGGKKTVVNTSDEDKDNLRRMKEIDSRDRMRGANIRQRRTAIDYNDETAG